MNRSASSAAEEEDGKLAAKKRSKKLSEKRITQARKTLKRTTPPKAGAKAKTIGKKKDTLARKGPRPRRAALSRTGSASKPNAARRSDKREASDQQQSEEDESAEEEEEESAAEEEGSEGSSPAESQEEGEEAQSEPEEARVLSGSERAEEEDELDLTKAQTQREQERQRRQSTMFLNAKILEENLASTLVKHGLRNMDADVPFMLNDAIKQKFTELLTDLVAVSRSAQSNSYLVNKNSQPREVTEVHVANVLNLDRAAGHAKPGPASLAEPLKLQAKKVADFDVVCTANPLLDLRALVEEELRRKDLKHQEALAEPELPKGEAEAARQTAEEETTHDDSAGRKRKKKHLDARQQEIKSQLERSKEHELIQRKHTNTQSTLEFFARGRPRADEDEFQKPQDLVPAAGRIAGAESGIPPRKQLNLNVYQSRDVERTKHDENYQKRIEMRDLLFLLQRDPHLRRSPLAYQTLVLRP